MPKKLISLKIDDADHEDWKRKAEATGMGLSEWIRERCNGNGEANHNSDMPRVAEIPDLGGSAITTGGTTTVTIAKPRARKSELAEAVAGRTRHEAGCGCFDCVQTERFFKQMRKEAE
jgi:hypothetical protein